MATGPSPPRSSGSREPWAFWGAFLALSATSLLLIWRYPFAPIADGPLLAYTSVVMTDLMGGGGVYESWHGLRPEVVSHQAFYVVMRWLNGFMPAHASLQTVLSLLVIGMPISLMLFFRALGRSRWLALGGFGVALSAMVRIGYIPYLLGLPLWVVSLALVEANAKRFRWWRCAALLAILLVAPYFHLIIAGLVLSTTFCWSLLAFRNWRDLGAQLAVSVLGGMAIYSMGAGGHGPMPEGGIATGPWPWAERWDMLLNYGFGWTSEGLDAWSSAVFGVCLLLCLIFARRKDAGVLEAHWWRRFGAYRLEWMTLCLFVAYFLLPRHIRWPYVAWGIAMRFPLCAAIAALGLPRGVPSGWGIWRVAPLALFSAFHLFALTGVVWPYGEKMAPAEAVAAEIAPGSRVLALYVSESPRHEDYGSFPFHISRHMAAWPAVLSQSYHPGSFCDAPYHPIDCRRALPGVHPRRPMAFDRKRLREFSHVVFYDNGQAARYGEAGARPPSLMTPSLTEVFRQGRWSLFEVGR